MGDSPDDSPTQIGRSDLARPFSDRAGHPRSPGAWPPRSAHGRSAGGAEEISTAMAAWVLRSGRFSYGGFGPVWGALLIQRASTTKQGKWFQHAPDEELLVPLKFSEDVATPKGHANWASRGTSKNRRIPLLDAVVGWVGTGQVS